ncbi:carbohydrate esterase family 4 protein [Plenodomus tracheiphilus IPT5]|uniref:Carbohydrate esterase family 4 protein n=1 Tax=Plenodomus tracheiphilus IPT5 TaxID=1408161 RepID=A0A6A7BL87_9PLEO|nr:carbohydrate esterase family 4 protein [Plenodomus tracheiphilus IPT5]
MREIQDSDDELDDIEAGIPPLQQQNASSLESLREALQTEHRAHFQSQPSQTEPQSSVSLPEHPSKRRKLSAAPTSLQTREVSSSKKNGPVTYGRSSKSTHGSTFTNDSGHAPTKFDPRPQGERDWNLEGTMRENYAYHEPMAMFPEASSTIANATQTQLHIMEGVRAPAMLGTSSEADVPRNLLPPELSVPWSEVMKLTPDDPHYPSGSSNIEEPVSESTTNTPSFGGSAAKTTTSQQSQRCSLTVQRGSPLQLEVAQEDSRPLDSTDRSFKVSPTVHSLKNTAVFSESSRRGESRSGLSVSYETHESEATFDEDAMIIGLPQEQYKPRPSRSRSHKADTQNAIDYLAVPERATKRRKTADIASSVEIRTTPQKSQQICDMGFTPITTKKALQQNGGDVTSTVDWLITNRIGEDELASYSTPRKRLPTQQSRGPVMDPAGLQVIMRELNEYRKDEPVIPKSDVAAPAMNNPIAQPESDVTENVFEHLDSVAAKSPKVQVIIAKKSPTKATSTIQGSSEPSKKKAKRRKTTLDQPEPGQTAESSTILEPALEKKRGRGRPKKTAESATLVNVAQEAPMQNTSKEQPHEALQVVEVNVAAVRVPAADGAVGDVISQGTVAVTEDSSAPTPSNAIEKSSKAQTPETSLKPSTPATKGKVPYRVGLSKRARIAPLLRVLKNGSHFGRLLGTGAKCLRQVVEMKGDRGGWCLNPHPATRQKHFQATATRFRISSSRIQHTTESAPMIDHIRKSESHLPCRAVLLAISLAAIPHHQGYARSQAPIFCNHPTVYPYSASLLEAIILAAVRSVLTALTNVLVASLVAPLVAAHGGVEGAPKFFGLPKNLRTRNPFAGHQVRHADFHKDGLHARQEADPEMCGKQGGGAVCAQDKCCSPEGYCGTTTDHCKAPDCQFEYGPACDAYYTPAGATTRNDPRPQKGNVQYGGEGIWSCNTPGTVAITYDDGPYIYTEVVLKLFKEAGMKATFFITGNNLGKGSIDEHWSGVIKQMYTDGHQIASHTWSHQDLSLITEEQVYDQMVKNEMSIRNIIGKYPTYMRPPFSSCRAESSCQKVMKALGYVVSYFDLDTADYTTLDKISVAQDNFKYGIDNINNEAIMGGNGDKLAIAHDIHQATAVDLTKYMIAYLKAKNLKGVTMGECLGDDKANWYRDSTPAPPRVSSTSSYAPAATPTGPTSINGACGTKNTEGKGQSCVGFTGPLGLSQCCSQHGWCGNTADHCSTGCQAGFGKCGNAEINSSASSSVSQAAKHQSSSDVHGSSSAVHATSSPSIYKATSSAAHPTGTSSTYKASTADRKASSSAKKADSSVVHPTSSASKSASKESHPTISYTDTYPNSTPTHAARSSTKVYVIGSSTKVYDATSLSTAVLKPSSTPCTTSPVTPKPTAPVSKDGKCGSQNGGQTCAGYMTPFGEEMGCCCITSGKCSNDPWACSAAGCAKGYGKCNSY